MTPTNRRTFLRQTGIALGATLFPLLTSCAIDPHAVTHDGPAPTADPAFSPDLAVTLTAEPQQRQLRPGPKTDVWTYRAEVTHGDPQAVQAIPDSYLGPIFRVQTGQKLRITFVNNLPDATHASIIHWHGLHLPMHQDGHNADVVAPGQTYVYEFTVTDRAGTYWFHPHPHGHISTQVMLGMAGLFIVSDATEAALALPCGAYDLPIVIQDRTYTADNQFDLGVDMMSGMMGFLGETIVMNGKADAPLALEQAVYRVRMLNGSHSRIYKLAWDVGLPLVVIGTDGGLLTAAVEKDFVLLAPGQRIELWLDLRQRPIDSGLTLISQRFSGAESNGGGMGMMHATNAPALGAAMDVLAVQIRAASDPAAQAALTLPTALYPLAAAPSSTNAGSPRAFHITKNGMQWLLNGRTYADAEVAADEIVTIDTAEVWQFVNDQNPGAMMDANGMAHPMHVHAGQFRILKRSVVPELAAGWDEIRAGLVDEGLHDTVLVMPGETVDIQIAFRDYTGLFLYHCHNLHHEDGGMMRNFRIDPAG